MIELKNIDVTFHQSGKTVEAVKQVNITIEDGDIYGIIGYSGAGKSTLVRTINLLQRPTNGTVTVSGVELTSLKEAQLRDARKKIGMIFQHFNLMNTLSVFENVAFPLKRSGLSKVEIKEKVEALLHLVGLEDKITSYPRQLSGGQKQRVAIARALANDPDVLLCDEATSALDPVTTKQILSLLKEINRKLGITIILVTHEMEVIKQICDNVAVMENGEIIELNSVYEMFSNPKTKLMQEFIANLHNDEDFEEHLAEHYKNETVIRVIFKGEATKEPLIQTLANKYNVTTNILAGRIEYIQNKQLGSLTFSVVGETDNTEKFVNHLIDQVNDVEVNVYGK